MSRPIYFSMAADERLEVDVDERTSDTRRFVSGVVLPDAGTVVVTLDDYRIIAIPLAAFEPGSRGPSGKTACGVGTKPDFSKPAIRDFGYTLAFGEFEACLDAVLLDAEARERV